MSSILRRGPFLLIAFLAASAVAAWAAQMRQIGIIDIPGQPGFQEAVFANGMLILSHEAGDTLDVFDPVRRRVVAQVKGLSGPHGIAVDSRAGRLYVGNSRSASVAVISCKDWKVERTIGLQTAPYNVALSPDGLRLYVANWRSRSVSAIDLGNGDRATTAEVGGSPQALVFDKARNVLFTSLQDTAEVVALNPSTLAVEERYKLNGSQPTALALNATERRLYVAVRHAVITLDADNGTENGRVAAPAGVDSLWLDPAAGMLYVASGGGLINVFRTHGGLTQIQELQTDVRGQTVAFDASRRRLYVPGGREGRSKLLILQQLPPTPAPEDPGEHVASR